MEEGSEISTKYQKLALEYSKLKAQIPVLKQAVGDEHLIVAELQELLKKKDQLVRKLEQEVECLNFRNVQLTKRVSILQNDLEVADTNSKHSKGVNQSSPLPESYNVLNVELQSRIEENERLHQQLYSVETENEKRISELTSTIEKLELNLVSKEKEYTEKIKEQEIAICSLQKEKIKMQVIVKNHEHEIKAHKSTEEAKTQDIVSTNKDLSTQLEEAQKIISNKVLFNDRNNSDLNDLNVPILQRRRHECISKLVFKLQGCVSDFSRQLSDLHNFMIQRMCSVSSDSELKHIVFKLETNLRESNQHLKVFPEKIENVTSAIKNETLAWNKSSIVEFSDAFQIYERSLDRILPLLILRVQNTDSWTASSPKLNELIPKLVCVTRKILACFNKLSRYLQLLSAIGSSEKKVYHISQTAVVKKILLNLEMLQNAFDEAGKLFGTKISLAHQLPILSQSEKSTDECILTSLVSLATTLKKIVDLIEKDIDIFTDHAWFKPRNLGSKSVHLNPVVWVYKDRSTKYIEQISQPESLSVPYEMALKNNQTLFEHADNQENLTQQLEHYQNKLMQLELDKENWMLECQLLKAKASENGECEPDSTDLKNKDYDEIHLYVKTTVNQLIKQIQFADSKSIAFKNECENLYQRLQLNLLKKEQLENEILEHRQVIDQMKEEQKNVVQSYNEQLNTLSEHLANLNETLTAQKDEIDSLKQTGNKGSRKSKGK